MADVRVQLTSRSGRPGAKDAPVTVHGEWGMHPTRIDRGFTAQLAELMEAARYVAEHGNVTDISILVYRDTTIDAPVV
jgi:hypothetical protein